MLLIKKPKIFTNPHNNKKYEETFLFSVFKLIVKVRLNNI